MAADTLLPTGREFLWRFRTLILLAWLIPPVFGLSFLLFIDLFTAPQLQVVMTTPLELAFVLGWLVLGLAYFDRFMRPLVTYLERPAAVSADRALARVRAFPQHFWGAFLLYLLLAPASVMFSAEAYTDFVAAPVDWFRIHLVALIVSIIVGLPIFFLLFDLFGRTLGGMRLERPVLSIRTKVFMIGALVPLLVDTMLVQYYWTRTGYFDQETLVVWFFLQLLAVAGALMFVRSFSQSLQPLEDVVTGNPALLDQRPSLRASSTDELGVLAGRYQGLLERAHYHSKALQVGNLILRSGDVTACSPDVSAPLAEALEQVVAICREALQADIAFLILHDEAADELVGVVHTGVRYDPQGHYRLPLSATSLAVLVFRERKLTAIDDVHNDPRVNPQTVDHFGIHAAIAAPLRVEDRVIGILLGADQRPGRHFSNEDRMLMEMLAREAATVVHTQLLHQRRIQAEAQYHRAEEFTRATLQSIGDGVVATDTEGRVEYLNPVAEQHTGWSSEEALGQPLTQVLKLVDETSGKPVADPVSRCLARGGGFSLPGQVALVNREGDREFAVEVRVSSILAADGAAIGVVLVFHDITELTTLTHRLSYQASHDALTGLVNRHEFEARLELALEGARHEQVEHALCYLDLDRFKVVNDTCGHVAGDELLKQLATRMRASIREADTLARLGGDEFGLLLEGCHLEQARGVAQNLLDMVRDFRFIWADKSFDVGISIGLVPISAGSGDITDVLSAADSACYAAKDEGRNRIHVFAQDDLAMVHQKGEMQWLQTIRLALENDDFLLYQQTIHPLGASHDEHYAEILLRLRGTGGEIITPNRFLPAAERYHLMPLIDRWVVTQALALMRRQADNGATMNLSINLSGQSLCDDQFMQFVTAAIRESGVAPQFLCFEVTETTAISNLSRAMALITELKRMGCSFALDDFGSGLSSFAYLKNLPVDYLKIDGSFVMDMDRNPIDRAMVEAINEIGHLMGIRTVAEFVTRAEVLQMLDEVGVDFAQGYLIACPAPFDAGPPGG